MLFSEEESKNLKHFSRTSGILNSYYNLFNNTPQFVEILTNYEIRYKDYFNLLKGVFINFDKILVDINNKGDLLNGIIDKLNLSLSENLNVISSDYKTIDIRIKYFFNFIEDFINSLNEWKIELPLNSLNLLETFCYTDTYQNFVKDTRLYSNNIYKDYYSDRDLNYKLTVLEKNINEIKKINSMNASDFKGEVDKFFSEQRNFFDMKVAEVIASFMEKSNEINNKYEVDIKKKVNDLDVQVTATQIEVNNLDQAIESYKSLVSKKVQNEISKHYKNKADMEKKIYWRATNLSILLILFSLGLLAWGLFDYYHDYISTSSCINNETFKDCVARLETIRGITKNIGISFFIMRLVFSLLLFLTVLYTSKIASRAYSHWRHSENMHLKLSSLEPFITELPKEVRHEIHKDLIPDYFGKDAGLVDTTNEKFKDLPANVSAVAMKAIEQISGSRSNSGTEKNGKKPEGETG